jgi:hypothetical protein
MEVGGQVHAQAALPPGKEPQVPIRQEAWWATEPVWTRWWGEKFPAPTGSWTLRYTTELSWLVGLRVNTDKTTYMFVFRYQNAG